ncbi:MAG: DUF1573 domain-containing protein [Bacteroidales bacterium]
MKLLVTTIITLFISSISILAADIRWNTIEHDLGIINEQDGMVTTQFELTNNTNNKIIITDIRKSCGCITVEYQHTEINPDESSIINVTYNPSGEIGEFKRSIIVSTSANNERERLTIKGGVNPTQQSIESKFPYQVAGFRLSNNTIFFGELMNNSSSSSFLQGYNNSAEPIELSFDNIPEYISLSSNIPNTINSGEKIIIIATFDGVKYNQLGGSNDHITLNIKYSDDSVISTQIEAIATVMEDFSSLSESDKINAPIISTSTDRLHFKQLDLNRNIIDSQKLIITNRGVNDLIIHKIYSLHNYINSKIIGNFVKSGESIEVIIYVTPSYIEPMTDILNKKITIISNDPTNPMKDIHLVGEITPINR